MNRAFVALLTAIVLGAAFVGANAVPASAATAPGKITFLAASCPASSSMYQRVVAGQDPNSGENGNAADPADIPAYGCTQTSGLGFFLLANSTAQSVFTDERLTNAATVSSTETGPVGATIMSSGTTVFVPGGVAQTRRFSISNYPVTITSRAAMPVLDLQCLNDGYNSDNADGAGWGDEAIAPGAQTYCIAYIWDGVASATATPTSVAPTATPTATATPSSTKSTITVNFPGLTSVHVYAHASDGVAGVAGGNQVASSTWKSDSTTMTVTKGTYDIRVVHGPTTVVIDNVNCSADCTVAVPLATLTVNFPGLTSAHTYAHQSDGQPGTYGAEDSSSTWKDNGTTLTLLQGVYDVRVVHGPTSVVLDNIDCQKATCSADVPLATLTVTFPGLTSAHTYAHKSDGAAGTVGAEDTSSTWKNDQTSMVLLQAVYDVRVVHGPMSVILDNIDCQKATCSASVPLATLTVNFPGLTSAHSYAHQSDGAAGTVGAEDTSSTWKDNGTSMVLLQGIYDVRVVHGPMQSVFDNIDCRSATCQVDVPLAKLTVNFPGLTSAHTYAHKSDGAGGSVGAEDSNSTWKDNGTSLTLLQGVYDVRVVHGPMESVFDNIDCRAATCQVDVPLATLTVNFPGLTSAHSYAHKSDGAAGSVGPEDSSSTWKDNGTSMILLQGLYDVRVVHGPMQSIFDTVDCRAATCQVDVPLAQLTVNFPGLTSAHTYAHQSDGAAGTFGAEDSSSTWKDNGTSLTLLQAVYDVRVVHGPTTSVIDNVDCRSVTCVVDVPLATLTVSFPGHTSVHTYVRSNDGASGTATGAEDSSSTWKNDGTSFTLLRNTYDVFMQDGSKSYVVDAVDCRSATCSVSMPQAATTATPAATVTPTATPSPTTVPATGTASATTSATASATTPGATVEAALTAAPSGGTSTTVDVMIPDGSGGWRLSSPAGQWAFILSSDNAKVSQTVRDGKFSLTAANYEFRFGGSADNTRKASIADFMLAPGGACEKPDGADTSFKLAPEDFKKYDSFHICAFLSEVQPTAAVKKTFVKADETTVVWKIEPSSPADLLVWDLKAESCEETGGALCGAITKGGPGSFTAGSKEQYLLVTQSYKKDGEACSVQNTAEWAANEKDPHQSVDASYICSGAPTMGWPLFSVFAAGLLGITWAARKKMQWPQ